VLGPTIAVAIFIPIYLFIIVLFFASHYTALRYRLTRTQWRGIRGGLAGSAFSFALRSIGYGILSGLTLYQFVPFATVRLWRYRLTNAFFGTAQAGFDGHGRHVYPRYLVSFLLSAAAVALIGGAFYAIMRDDFTLLAVSRGTGISQEAKDAQERINRAAIVAYLAAGLLVYLALMLYRALLVRYIARGTSLAGLRFESTVTARRLAGLMIGNILLMVVTLGIGYPLVLQRIWRFGGDNFLVHGALDGTVIEQSRLLPPRMGEGWLEVLDPGFV
jgi:uncharacterized membrane protein YjgN (DUF898 family)